MNTRPDFALQHNPEHGAVLVEFALLAPLFLVLIFSAIEASLMLFCQTTMQYALREGMRFAVVNHGMYGVSPDFNRVVQIIRHESMGFYDRLQPVYEVSIDGNRTEYSDSQQTEFTDAEALSPNMFGARGALVRVRLHLRWPLITPLAQSVLGREYRFNVAATMQNEPE